jgi:ribonuclease VapC
MVLDTSAIVATVTNEPDGQRYRKAMLDAASLSMSAVAILETKIVLSARFGASAVKFFDELLETAGIVVVPFDADMAKGAFEAFQRFGKGGGHPAQLNIVDCAVYAWRKRVRNRCSSREPTLLRQTFSPR